MAGYDTTFGNRDFRPVTEEQGQLQSAAQNIGEEMHGVMSELYPICRSITGDGVRKTLESLGRIAPMTIHEVASGTECFDWVVPDEWNIRDACIADESGHRIIDFRKSNLHVVGYSEPVDTTLTMEELRPHLHTRPDLPDAIPYVTSYYQRRWGFCLSENQLSEMSGGPFHVFIDATLAPGSLSYGEIVLPGRSEKEILLSSYVCHPSMANNELSGPVLTAFLAKHLMQMENRTYTYRIVFVPETIGALCYLSRNLPILRERCVGGYVLTCVGGPDDFTYLTTPDGDSLIDRTTIHTLASSGRRHRIVPYAQRGSDERQYNAPGVDLGVGSLMRSKYGNYGAYHTSDDDLDFVTPDHMSESFNAYVDCINTLEINTIARTTTLGEPNLGKRGLYPTFGAGVNNGEFVDNLLAILGHANGARDLIDIAERHNKRATDYALALSALVENQLIDQEIVSK